MSVPCCLSAAARGCVWGRGRVPMAAVPGGLLSPLSPATSVSASPLMPELTHRASAFLFHPLGSRPAVGQAAGPRRWQLGGEAAHTPQAGCGVFGGLCKLPTASRRAES